jgi:glyoxylase-like metal-dependent hydrolase (beta-lactamase superfamily II)
MVSNLRSISADTLRRWLEEEKEVTVIDVRPSEQQEEWNIPGSIHINAYKKLKAGDPGALAGLQIDKGVPVVTVCAAGKTSQLAAYLLRKEGYDAYSLEGGMKGWSMAWNTAALNFKSYQILQIRRTGKGCLSYIVASEEEAVVIDASLPVEVYEQILRGNGWRLKAVAETHIHADHLSRSKPLADRYRVTLYLPATSKVEYPYTPLRDQDRIPVGEITLKAISTPGHTLESLSFLLNGEVLFSGDTLFISGVGRPDLKADENSARLKADLLYDSLQILLNLDKSILVLPAHTSSPVAFDGKIIGSNLGDIRKSVPLLQVNKEQFTQTLLAHIPAPPPNYTTIVEKNLHGEVMESEAVELEAGANRCSI